MFAYQAYTNAVGVWSDTDYAGCMETRKSTTGTVVTFGSHTLRASSSTQSVNSLSSGEAEYYGLLRGASLGIGAQALLADLGVKPEKPCISLRSDASAAIGIGMRRGLGK